MNVYERISSVSMGMQGELEKRYLEAFDANGVGKFETWVLPQLPEHPDNARLGIARITTREVELRLPGSDVPKDRSFTLLRIHTHAGYDHHNTVRQYLLNREVGKLTVMEAALIADDEQGSVATLVLQRS